MLATLVMEPASFMDPSTLYTGIGWDKFWVGILVHSTKPSLMKSPVALQSTRASIPTSSTVSVVLRCTGIKIELGPCLSDQMTSLEVSFFSHLGQCWCWCWDRLWAFIVSCWFNNIGDIVYLKDRETITTRQQGCMAHSLQCTKSLVGTCCCSSGSPTISWGATSSTARWPSMTASNSSTVM